MDDRLRSFRARASAVSVMGWIALGLALLVAICTQRGRFYHGDALFLAELYDHCAVHFRFAGWEFPDAGYFFPDLVVFFLLRFLLGSLSLTYVAYAAVQTLVFSLALAQLARKVSGEATGLHLACIAVVTAYLVLMSFAGCFAPPNVLEVHQHFGAVVMLFICLLLAVKIWERDSGKLDHAHFVLCVVSTATVASDFLFAVQFVCPLLVMIGLGYWLQQARPRTSVILCCAAGLSVPFGMAIHRFTGLCGNMSGRAHINLSALTASFQRGYEMVLSALHAHPFASIAWGSFMILATVTVVRGARDIRKIRNPGKSEDAGPLLILSFFVCSVIINMAATVLTGVIRVDYSKEYLLPALIIPVFFGWPFLLAGSGLVAAAYARVGRLLVTVAFAVLALTVLVFRPFPSVADLKGLSDWYPAAIASFDEEAGKRGLKRGIAHYWQARTINVLSKRGMKTVQGLQVFSDLQPYYKNNDFNTFDTNLDYVVLDPRADSVHRFDENRLITRFGPPADRFVCQLGTVLIYNREQDSDFRTCFARLYRQFRILSHIGGAAEFCGDALLREPAEQAETHATRPFGPSGRSLVHTPYVRLPRGMYSLHVEYSTHDDPAFRPMGRWFVKSADEWKGTQKIVKEAEFPLNGEPMPFSTFDLGAGAASDLVVIGIEGPSVSDFRVRKIKISRMH
jgi:hypothetical protein